jgi:hypothetical protein
MTGVYDATDMTLFWFYNLRRGTHRNTAAEFYHGRKTDVKFKMIEVTPKQYTIHLVDKEFDYQKHLLKSVKKNDEKRTKLEKALESKKGKERMGKMK